MLNCILTDKNESGAYMDSLYADLVLSVKLARKTHTKKTFLCCLLATFYRVKYLFCLLYTVLYSVQCTLYTVNNRHTEQGPIDLSFIGPRVCWSTSQSLLHCYLAYLKVFG